MNKPITLCDRCEKAARCLLNYDGKPCRKNRTVQPSNYDRIISKSPEELAEWINHHSSVCVPGKRPGMDCPIGACGKCWLDWLRQEADS